MRIIKKLTGIFNEMTIINDDVYHLLPYGHPKHHSICKNEGEILMDNTQTPIVKNGLLYFSSYNEDKCWIYDGKIIKLISDKFRIAGIYDSYFSCYSDQNGNYKNFIVDQNFKLYKQFDTHNDSDAPKGLKLVFREYFVYRISNIQIEVTNKQNEKLYSYDVRGLGLFMNYQSGDELEIRLSSLLYAYQNILILSTNNGWLIGLEINTGKELWLLKGLPEAQPEPNEKNKNFGFSDTSKIKLDEQRGVLYCFLWNIYWEWDIMTQQLVKLCHNFQKAQKEHYTYLGLNYFMEGDIIYYADGGTLLEHEGRISWPRLIAVNKITGDIIDQLEFKPKTKKEKEILTWKDFQYSNNQFYLLDNNHVLWIVEK